MNIYKLTRTTHSYDEYDSCVVVAESESAARLIHPASDTYYWAGDCWRYHCDGGKERYTNWEENPYNLKVQLLGVATPTDALEGVVCASFNAG